MTKEEVDKQVEKILIDGLNKLGKKLWQRAQRGVDNTGNVCMIITAHDAHQVFQQYKAEVLPF